MQAGYSTERNCITACWGLKADNTKPGPLNEAVVIVVILVVLVFDDVVVVVEVGLFVLDVSVLAVVVRVVVVVVDWLLL